MSFINSHIRIEIPWTLDYIGGDWGAIGVGVQGVGWGKRKLSQLLDNEAETRLTPLEATSALSTACSLLNQRPLILTAESTLEEKQILCPAYLTCSDLDLQNTSCSGDPKTWRRFAAHQSTLTQRASMVQDRIDKFKKTFDTFMTRQLVSLGHFEHRILEFFYLLV